MIRLSLLLLLMLGSIHGLNAQAKATYHVNTKTLLLKSAPRSKAKTLKELKKYDNLTLRQSKANKKKPGKEQLIRLLNEYLEQPNVNKYSSLIYYLPSTTSSTQIKISSKPKVQTGMTFIFTY